MMKNKFLVSAFTLLLFVGFNSYGQRPEPTEAQKQEMKAERDAFKTSLNLSADQSSKFDEISKRYQDQMQALRKTNLTREERSTQMRKLKADLDSEMKALLNEEQYRTYKEHMKNKKKQMRAKRGM